MKRSCLQILLTVSVLLSWITSNGQDYVYRKPAALKDGWETISIKDISMDTSKIHAFLNQIKKEETKVHSILLVKDGAILLEEYLNGYDGEKPHDLRSVTKSIRSILLGIAIDKGFIQDLNDPISKYLKEPTPKKNLDPRKDQITIKHLITMSSGLDCNDWDKKSKGQEDKVYKKKDWVQYTLDLPMINDPGEVSTYCSMGSLLVAEIIRQTSGMTIDEFAEKYLFTPLGVSNVLWDHTSEKEVISSGKRLHMTSRDMAKIGQLILNRGEWNGLQIVSKIWVEQATSTQTQITGINYGYFWWNMNLGSNEDPVYAEIATGNGGQYIMAIPKLNLVAVFTGGAYNSQEDKLPFAIMNNIVLPALSME